MENLFLLYWAASSCPSSVCSCHYYIYFSRKLYVYSACTPLITSLPFYFLFLFFSNSNFILMIHSDINWSRTSFLVALLQTFEFKSNFGSSTSFWAAFWEYFKVLEFLWQQETRTAEETINQERNSQKEFEFLPSGNLEVGNVKAAEASQVIRAFLVTYLNRIKGFDSKAIILLWFKKVILLLLFFTVHDYGSLNSRKVRQTS